jgi:hypothetical protein
MRGIVAEPQVELWLESGEPLSAAETSLAREQAREALQQALDSRAIAPSPLGAQDPVLVVRERGISRTASRKRDQVGATIGLAVGVVVVVAVIVAIAVSGGKDSPKATAPKSAPSAKAPSVPKPHAGPIPKSPPPPPPPPVGGPAPARYVGYPQPWPWFDFYLAFSVPPRPLILRPQGDLGAPPPPEPGGEEIVEAPPLELPPPPQFDVEDRGFFSGDDTVVQFDLLDRATGKLLWSKEAHGGDPRDPDDMRKMVNEALDGVGWAPRIRNPERASR